MDAIASARFLPFSWEPQVGETMTNTAENTRNERFATYTNDDVRKLVLVRLHELMELKHGLRYMVYCMERERKGGTHTAWHQNRSCRVCVAMVQN
jgi:hypothetical protein